MEGSGGIDSIEESRRLIISDNSKASGVGSLGMASIPRGV